MWEGRAEEEVRDERERCDEGKRERERPIQSGATVSSSTLDWEVQDQAPHWGFFFGRTFTQGLKIIGEKPPDNL